MYVHAFSVQDLKCFAGFHRIDLGISSGEDKKFEGWVVLAGRNGTGKTTLLRALAAAAIGPDRAKRLVGDFSGWLRAGNHVFGGGASRPTTNIQVENIGPVVGDDPALSIFLKESHDIDVLGRVGGLNWYTETESAEEFHARRDGQGGHFLAAYGAYHRLGGAPSATQLRFQEDLALSSVVGLFDEDATLFEGLPWIDKLHARALERRNGAEKARAQLLELLGDDLLPGGKQEFDLDSEGLHLKQDGRPFVIGQLSDGYKTAVGLVLHILQLLDRSFGDLKIERHKGKLACMHPGVVLIDEVDAHLHPSWQQRIGFWLKERFPKVQFIVTTHSPFVCQAADVVIRLPKPGTEEKTRRMEGQTFYRIVNGSADDAVMTELFGLDHPHSPRSEQLREEVAKLEERVMDAVATDVELVEYQSLKTKLPSGLGEEADRALRRLVGQMDLP